MTDEVHPVQQDGSLIWLDVAREEIEHGCFSGTVGSNQRSDGSLVQVH